MLIFFVSCSNHGQYQRDRDVLVLHRVIFETNGGSGALSSGPLQNVDVRICRNGDLGTVFGYLCGVAFAHMLMFKAKLPPCRRIVVFKKCAKSSIHRKVAPVDFVVRRWAVLRNETLLGDGNEYWYISKLGAFISNLVRILRFKHPNVPLKLLSFFIDSPRLPPMSSFIST